MTPQTNLWVRRCASPTLVAVCGAVRFGSPDESNPANSRADVAVIHRVLDRMLDDQRRRGGSFRILTGTAEGADAIARQWATERGAELFASDLDPGRYPVPMHRYNEMLLAFGPDIVLAFKHSFDEKWNEDSCVAGTEHMCRIAARAGTPVLLNGSTWLDAT